MKILAVVQARTGSTRLPGKVLKKVCGKTILEHQMSRMSGAKTLSEIIVATTTNPEDDKIIRLCIDKGYRFFRGEENDLLDRHYQAVKNDNPDAVVKIPSDCPLIDPEIIDKVINTYIRNKDEYDYVSNLHPATYPDGNDVEIMSFKALKTAWNMADNDFEREHTTPYIWDNPGWFNIGNVSWENGLDYSESHRFTLDYEEDFIFIKSVFEELYPFNPKFKLNDILSLLKSKPEISKFNENHNGKTWFKSYINKLKTMNESFSFAIL